MERVTRSYDEAFADEDPPADAFRRRATRAALLAVEWKPREGAAPRRPARRTDKGR
ncbi:MAG: hypothetical protein KF819_20560 [Labilithrix sp.]|nr:hypothetical protein [Labilithrix sp.]